MTRKRAVIISVFLLTILLTGLSIYHLSSKDDKNTDYENELYSKLNDIWLDLCTTEAYEYVWDNFLNSSSDITLTATLDKLSTIPDYQGLSISTNTMKNSDGTHFLTDIRGTYRGIQLISGKLEYKGSNIRLYSPSIYDKIICSDFKQLKDKAGLIFNNNILYQIIYEIKEMYPDTLIDISDNIYVTYDNAYSFTIKSEAVKDFLLLIKDYISEGKISQSFLSSYISSEYYANPNNAEYYTLEKYKEQYIESNLPYVTNAFIVAADLINFDITIEFKTDEKDNIIAIAYDEGTDDISATIDIKLTPYNNTYNTYGYVAFRLNGNELRIDITHDNSKKDNIYITTNNTSASVNDDRLFEFAFDSKLDTKADIQTLIFELSSPSYDIGVGINADYKRLSGDIITLKGEELKLSELSLLELSSFVAEIKNNLTEIKERFD